MTAHHKISILGTGATSQGEPPAIPTAPEPDDDDIDVAIEDAQRRLSAAEESASASAAKLERAQSEATSARRYTRDARKELLRKLEEKKRADKYLYSGESSLPSISSAQPEAEDLEVEIEDAQRRLSAAKKLTGASAAKVERARSEVTSSRKELRDARKYLLHKLEEKKRTDENSRKDTLRRLEERNIEGKGSHVDASDDDRKGIDLISSLSMSGADENEAVGKIPASTKNEEVADCVDLLVLATFSGETEGGQTMPLTPCDDSEGTSREAENEEVTWGNSGFTKNKKLAGCVDLLASVYGETESGQTMSMTPCDDSEGICNAQTSRVMKADASAEKNVCSPGVAKEDKDGATSEEEEAIISRKQTGMSDVSEITNFELEDSNTTPGKRQLQSLAIEKDEDESYNEFLSFISEDNSAQELDDNFLDDLISKCDSIVDGSEVEVKECGIPEINGKYHRFGMHDDVPAYSKVTHFGGKEMMFNISRWQSNNGTKKWYITATVPCGSSRQKQLVFYVAYSPSFFNRPPRKTWMAVTEGNELFLSPEYKGRGIFPVPVIFLESDGASIRRRKLGKQISYALSSNSSRGCSYKRTSLQGSLPSMGSLSTTRSMKRENIPTSVYLPPSLFS
mmetsp:Transcript_3277/g.8354  ORF Transcript_3277/g.8354 Transcript_3277/m.8354 type:complete len:625 (-) Transcript_3277:145-2019(-)